MSVEGSSDSCYCCAKPQTSGMDMDAALSELGMLSSVTDMRKQYVNERAERTRRRNRLISEPSTSASSLEVAGVCMTPSNSPNKANASNGSYQIVQLNTQFVTSLSSGLNALEASQAVSQEAMSFGSHYSQETLEQEARANRISRTRSRLRRFRKPYELPFLHRHSIDTCYSSLPDTSVSTDNSNDSLASADEKPGCSTPPQHQTLDSVFRRPAAAASKQLSASSNLSTPEKTVVPGAVCRSKSLDDLDFSKLRLAEAENHNFILQKKEMDSVSQYMENLHVNE